jgi:hypothetical protein
MKKAKKTEEHEYMWSLKVPMYIGKKDERYNKYVEQLKKDGFSDTETWGLDSVIAQFILPRLIRFKEVTNGYPPDFTMEKWQEMLDKMIFAFDWTLNHDKDDNYNLSEEVKKANWKRYSEGMRLFSDNFTQLWW